MDMERKVYLDLDMFPEGSLGRNYLPVLEGRERPPALVERPIR